MIGKYVTIDGSAIDISCPACIELKRDKESFHSIDEVRNHFRQNEGEVQHDNLTPFHEMSLDELSQGLDCTIKRDKVSKCITFLNMLNAQTADNQFNIMFSAESSTGKSYISLELAHYFPETEIVELAGASPTSLIHESGTEVIETHDQYVPLAEYIKKEVEELEELEFAPKTQENKKRTTELKRKIVDARRRAKIVVDYEGKIVIFLDQPNVQLLSRLRPFLSHDKKMLEFHITDKNARGSNKTKNIVIIGYSSIIFCTASSLFDEQESTRNIVLSPESDPDKVKAALELLTKKMSNKSIYTKWLDTQPYRKALIFRTEMIRASRARQFKLYDLSKVYDIFIGLHKVLRSRHSRDYARLYNIIYGSTLLNLFTRDIDEDGVVTATQIDIDNGFDLYKPVMEANELGLSPEVYGIYNGCILPYYLKHVNADPGYEGLTVAEISTALFDASSRIISHARLTTQIIPTLMTASLLTESKLSTNKRFSVYIPTIDRGRLDKLFTQTLDSVLTDA